MQTASAHTLSCALSLIPLSHPPRTSHQGESQSTPAAQVVGQGHALVGVGGRCAAGQVAGGDRPAAAGVGEDGRHSTAERRVVEDVVVDEGRHVNELDHWFDLTPAGMLVYDASGLVLRSNASIEALLGSTPVMLSGVLLRVILPEASLIQVEHMRTLIVREAAQGQPPEPVRRLAALLPPSPDVAEIVAARLRLSKAQRARLVSAAERLGEDADNPRALAYSLGMPFARDRLLLLGADTGALSGWEPPVFPLKGGAIVARGVTAGPEVARVLQAVERRWVAEGFPGENRIGELLTEAIPQD